MRLDTETIDILKTVLVDGNRTFMPQLTRAQYVKVNKALELLGGKWNRGAKAHVWEDDPGDPIADAVLTGEIRDWRKELQFFPTPVALAHWMVKLAGLPADNRGPDLRVLEPSAGNGAICRAIRDHIHRCELTLVEINPKMAEDLKESQPLATVHCGDFLKLDGIGLFDAVIMNPPFSKGQDIAHVQHAYTFLKPGGRLVAITAPGWTFRTDRRNVEFRAWTREVGATQYDQPEGTFKESGTMIRTVALLITKPKE